MLFSHCFLEYFLSSGAIFLKVRSNTLLELFTQPYVAHKDMTTIYIYKPQGRDSKPNTAVKSPKLLDEKFEKQCLEKIITLKVFCN